MPPQPRRAHVLFVGDDSEAPLTPGFAPRTIDDDPDLLAESYRLRYRVYCLERRFLPAGDYPDGLERDDFDLQSVHVGAIDGRGGLAATARVVKPGPSDLPLLLHCTVFPHVTVLSDARNLVVEVSRVSISRYYSRRPNDSSLGGGLEVGLSSPGHDRHERRQHAGEPFLTLLRAVVYAAKRLGATHLIGATEVGLHRWLVHYGFPYRRAGPEADYNGRVAPYIMSLAELDEVVRGRQFAALAGFPIGTDPERWPDADEPEGDLPRAPGYPAELETRLLAEVRRATEPGSAYRTLLDEHGVRVEQVRNIGTFSRLCPVLSRHSTFDRFSLADLSCTGLNDISEVLTSSGHGGRFSFGVTSRTESAGSAAFVDAALDAAFAVKSRRTLLVNCLPMGVVVSSHCMTVATTSVREDMAVALVQAFGGDYEQVILLGDPLFMKRLTDHAVEQAVNWRRYRINVVLGEEIFGEHLRTYLAQCFGLDADCADGGYIMSSLGVAELGLHLAFETPATIALRRRAVMDPALAQDLLGRSSTRGRCVPMVLTFNPLRSFIEILEPDADGYGKMTISMLDPGRPIPLLRYQTGDVARLLDRDRVAAVAGAHGVQVPDVPDVLLAFQGRDREALPNGSHVGVYKDALYANRDVARHLTGALRLIFNAERFTMHVQLVRERAPDTALEDGLLQAIASEVRPERLVLWPYARFPFGMGLDYERKFAYYVPGEMDVDSGPA